MPSRPSALSSAGDLLRFWRSEVADRNMDFAARAAGVSSVSTIHNWETGKGATGPSIDQLRALDKSYSAGGALADMYAALRTPDALDALDAAEQWWHNFQGTSRPCWAWLRVPGSRDTQAVVEVGPFSFTTVITAGIGVFVQAQAFVSNPPVQITLHSPGWVDFGYGALPAQLPAQIIDAAESSLIGTRADLDPALTIARAFWFPGRFGRDGWFSELRRSLGARVEVARELFTSKIRDGVGSPADLRSRPALLEPVPRRWDGERYRELRKARGMTLDSAADLVTFLDTTSPVTRDQVHRFENGTTPRIADLVCRLDAVYRADGRMCCWPVPTETHSEHAAISFPHYWVGPVWVQFLRNTGAATGEARLRWTPWQKQLRVSDSVVVTCRRSEPSLGPLQVFVPPGWSIAAGIGDHPHAIDVNDGWGFITMQAAATSLTDYYAAIRQALTPSNRGKGGRSGV